MTTADDNAMPIGAVARLTGISSHTLRKWESRYGAVRPIRADSGRRLYTQEQVRRLIYLRDLTEQGHQISRLSQLGLEELQALTAQNVGQQRQPPSTEFSEVLVVGRILTAVFAAQVGRALPGFRLLADDGASWLESPSEKRSGLNDDEHPRALAIELPTLSAASLRSLLQLRQRDFARIIVVYGFATRATLRELHNAGILCLKAPLSGAELLQNLGRTEQQTTALELLASACVPLPRYSTESIADMAALAPSVECECPNHIARLLAEISAFEQYSMECEDSDPAERELHARLRLIAAHARALFEEGLENVASAEGIELKPL